jgi:hypothetical protein
MAVKTPIRTVYTNSVATGLAEYQSGEFIALAHGGLGASLSIGSAGQVLKVNSGASALEFGGVEAVLNIDGMTDGSGVTLAATDKLAFSDGGTEKYLLASQIDTYISATSATLTNKTLTTPIIAEIDSGSTITLDATTDIVLDADGGDIFFKDGGTTFGSATNTSGNLIIKSGTTTALTMSGANVTVAGDLTVSGTTTTVDSTTINIQNSFVFEGATDDAYETTLTTVDPTADRTLSLPNATDTLIGKATTDTLTNKSIDLGNNTLTGSLAEFNSALQSESFASLTGTETLTNKTLTSPTINGGTFSGTFTGTMNATSTVFSGASPLVFEGATADAYETTLAFVDPTADKTVYMPNATGYLPVLSAASTTVITATPTELNYVDGVTSAIQTQLTAKATKAFAIAQSIALG